MVGRSGYISPVRGWEYGLDVPVVQSVLSFLPLYWPVDFISSVGKTIGHSQTMEAGCFPLYAGGDRAHFMAP